MTTVTIQTERLPSGNHTYPIVVDDKGYYTESDLPFQILGFTHDPMLYTVDIFWKQLFRDDFVHPDHVNPKVELSTLVGMYVVTSNPGGSVFTITQAIESVEEK